MKDYALYIFDLDGVIYRGNEPVPGAREAVEKLQRRGKTIRYLTNNSSKTRNEYAAKLQSLGLCAEPKQVYSSASATARFLQNAGAKNAFVIGQQGLIQELAEVGINSVPDRSDWVVVGICWDINYSMIDTAQRLIRGGARFIATNPDPTYPDEGGALRPGAGAMVAAVAAASGRSPDTIIGKPEPTLVHQIWDETGVAPNQTLLIGDRQDTDVLCAYNAGCDSALVLTGVSAEPTPSSPEATYILETLHELA